MDSTPSTVLDQLYLQHEIDLEIYRESHQDWHNRLLHHIFIPLETAGLFALVNMVFTHSALVKERYNSIINVVEILPYACSWTLGLLSLILSPDPLGFLVLLFHCIAIPWLMKQMQQQHQRYNQFILMLTIVSWGIQICIGHWILERNQPTFQQGTASALSMVTSIVIAWKS